jgi:hypothetical protein
MLKFDLPFFLLRKASLQDLLTLGVKKRFLPLTYSLDMPIKHIRAWGGRRLNDMDNPFTAALNGLNFDESVILYEEKISSIRSHYALTLNNFDNNFFYNEIYPWDKKLNPSKKLEQLSSTLKNELKININTTSDLDNRIIINTEIKRLLLIYQSLKKTGYSEKIANYTPLRANFLKKGDKFVALIRHGEHRIACLPKIGKKKVRLWIRSCDMININMNNNKENAFFNHIYNGNLNNSPLVNCYGYFFV